MSKKIKLKMGLDAGEAINICIDKIGVKKVLKLILKTCSRNTIERTTFPSSLLASAKDEELAAATCALFYLEKNWDEAVALGGALLMELRESVGPKKHVERCKDETQDETE